MAGLLIRSDICTGCMNCQTVCALRKTGRHDRSSSAIRVNLHLFSGKHTHIYCRQCERAACNEACPVNAIHKNENTGAWNINKVRCLNCGKCVEACPFGAMFQNRKNTLPFKCDLCSGELSCLEACTFGAITFNGNQK